MRREAIEVGHFDKVRINRADGTAGGGANQWHGDEAHDQDHTLAFGPQPDHRQDDEHDGRRGEENCRVGMVSQSILRHLPLALPQSTPVVIAKARAPSPARESVEAICCQSTLSPKSSTPARKVLSGLGKTYSVGCLRPPTTTSNTLRRSPRPVCSGSSGAGPAGSVRFGAAARLALLAGIELVVRQVPAEDRAGFIVPRFVKNFSTFARAARAGTASSWRRGITFSIIGCGSE